MSGGGGSTTTVQKTELPQWLQDAAQQNLARADYVSQLGYVPQYGLDVAGFSPMQQSAFQNTADAASAFGLQAPSNPNAYMPQASTNNLGFTGYSSGALFDQYLNNLAQQRPEQKGYLDSMFIDPYSGELGIGFTPQGSVTTTNAPMSVQNNAGTVFDHNEDGGVSIVGGLEPLSKRTIMNDFGKFNPMTAGIISMLPMGGAITAWNQSQAAKEKAAYDAARAAALAQPQNTYLYGTGTDQSSHGDMGGVGWGGSFGGSGISGVQSGNYDGYGGSGMSAGGFSAGATVY